MPMQDDEFINRLRATFQVEAEEHLQAISSALLDLEKEPGSAQTAARIEHAYREAHSLKGAARAVDLRDIESICQAMEGAFSHWKQKALPPPPGAFDVLHRSLDLIRASARALGTPASPAAQHQQRDLVHQLTALQTAASSSPVNPPIDMPAHPPLPPTEPGPSAPPAEGARTESDRGGAPESVRISLAKLDARLLQAEDMLNVKALTARRATDLRALSEKIAGWWPQWARISSEVRSSRWLRQDSSPEMAGIAEFLEWNCDFIRSLEARLAALASQGQKDRYAVERRVDDLLEDSKKLVMLPFSSITGVFPRLVRDLCREQNKDADLLLQGQEVEIDKRILEEMKDALIHMLRNAVDHGVESPADRSTHNKPSRATIKITVSRVNGSKVEIAIADDGRGVDLERIRESAVRNRLLSSDDAAKLSDPETLPLVFQSDVSTSPVVTSVSGRGLGMAIVRAKAEKLGGRVSIESTPGQGTTLRITLPVTMATFRGVLVTAAAQTFVIPATSIERVVRVGTADIHTAENRETVSVNGQVLSVARLEAILQLAPSAAQKSQPSLTLIILQSGGARIACAVDDVLHEEEVLVKNFQKPLVRVRNIAAATILHSGKPVPILHVGDLIKSARVHGIPPALSAAPQNLRAAPQAPRILVVEDSITSRMLLKGVLESAGYQVKVAVDGMDAFTILREEHFDLVVSDVEMPRVNGFDLTARIRADKRLSELPVVLVTALESLEQRERGIDVGADAYLVKSSFDQNRLLDVIRRLI
jgi:two-component system chemotaxis sensor kinase CheA